MTDETLSAAVFLAMQVATVVTTAATGAGVPIFAKPRVGDAKAIFAGAAAAGAAGAVMTMIGAGFGVGPFGVLRLLYLAGVVGMPLAAATVLAAGRVGRIAMTPIGAALAVFGLLAAPLGIYVSWIEPNRLTVERATLTVSSARAGKETITLGVLADLQADSIGAHERAAIDLLMAQRPDVILIPGDLFQGTPSQWEASREALGELLGRLDAPGGVYFVVGDVDDGNTLQVLGQTRIHILRDGIARVRVRDRDITIGGVTLTHTDALRTLEALAGTEDIRILLGHRPDHVFSLADTTRVDLTVAGHTHGGQVVIPGFGPLITMTAVPRAVAAGGLHQVAGHAIYVSRGVGMERLNAPPMRFNCVPEVSVITLSGP